MIKSKFFILFNTIFLVFKNDKVQNQKKNYPINMKISDSHLEIVYND